MNEHDLTSLVAGNELSPQAVVDEASITNCMSKNKESLQKKLMLRRPVDVLVDQGILPPPKSSPTFYEQRHRLERAKTEDFLKRKIQSRPNRNELIQQHILEDSFDPSYYEQQRRLKKARLADDLNERLSHRPGPLELIKGNILHTDETLEQAIKEGQITFKKTCEGEIITNPPKRFVFEEESSSDSAPSPSLHKNNISTTGPSYPVTETPFLLTATLPPTSTTLGPSSSTLCNANISYIVNTGNCLQLQQPEGGNLGPGTVTFPSCLNNNNNLGPQTLNNNQTTLLHNNNNNNTEKTQRSSQLPAQGNNQKPKKKVKSKNQTKTRTIKFHEYTGPPNVKKSVNASQSETSYDLLLQQQQLFLQWQLECQQKFPDLNNKPENITINEEEMAKFNEMMNKAKEDNNNNKAVVTGEDLFAPTDKANANKVQESEPPCLYFNGNTTSASINAVVPAPAPAPPTMPAIKKIISKLEDMKVNDLKAELKKRNLPVSGPKQQLIERLRPFSDNVVSENNCFLTAEHLNGGTMVTTPAECTNTQFITNNDLIKANNITTICNGPNQTFILKGNTLTPSNSIKVNGEEYVLLTNNNVDGCLSSLQFAKHHQPPPPINPITFEASATAPTLAAIPLGGFIPQYQLVTSTPTDNKFSLPTINLANATNLQQRLGGNILVNNKLNIINPTGNVNFVPQPGGLDKNVTILTPATLGLKSGGSGNIALNLPQAMPTSLANTLVTIPATTTPVIHQVLLYPNCLNQTEDINSMNFLQKQRSNSLPGESMHQLQRNTSMPVVGEKMSKAEERKTKTKADTAGNRKLTSLKQNTQVGTGDTSRAKGNAQRTTNNKAQDKSETRLNTTTLDTTGGNSTINSQFNTQLHSPPCTNNINNNNNNVNNVNNTNVNNINNVNTISNNVNTNLEPMTQPDSTTNIMDNSFDFDLINFDDLNDLSTAPDGKDMMDLNDNWLEMALAGTASMEQSGGQLKHAENNYGHQANGFNNNNNNNMFDVRPSGTNLVSQPTDIDSILAYDTSLSQSEAMILDDLSNLAQSIINNQQQQQQQAQPAPQECPANNFMGYNNNSSNNKLNFFSPGDSLFGDNFFGESDFKNSIDSIL